MFSWLFGFLLGRLFSRKKKKGSGLDTLPVIEKASHKGKQTGYEPRFLKDIFLPKYELMFGEPGKGLGSSGFANQNIQLGQKGELSFAKALQKSGQLSRLLTFWSVHNLGLNDEKLEADIDCIIVSGRTIWLLDLKFYASGDVTYRSVGNKLYTIDNATGHLVKKPKYMTRNMSFADRKFREKFTDLTKYFSIQSRVVLMPTDSGAGVIDDVYWPGNIPAISLTDMLGELAQEPGFVDTIGGQKLKQTFQILTKRR